MSFNESNIVEAHLRDLLAASALFAQLPIGLANCFMQSVHWEGV